ncbi:MAG: FG-GAP repeat protein [Ahniella sp.]|nr:FG-GAP repeat protein [Ahniella sp.]
MSIVGVGDVNGDGLGDMAIGSVGNGNASGNFRILFGSAPFNSGLDQSWTGSATSALCTQGLANAGDVNGDGYSDLLVGCPNEQISGGNRGVVRRHQWRRLLRDHRRCPRRGRLHGRCRWHPPGLCQCHWPQRQCTTVSERRHTGGLPG